MRSAPPLSSPSPLFSTSLQSISLETPCPSVSLSLEWTNVFFGQAILTPHPDLSTKKVRHRERGLRRRRPWSGGGGRAGRRDREDIPLYPFARPFAAIESICRQQICEMEHHVWSATEQKKPRRRQTDQKCAETGSRRSIILSRRGTLGVQWGASARVQHAPLSRTKAIARSPGSRQLLSLLLTLESVDRG